VAGVTNSNGIAWSADGDHCYYIDTPTRKVIRYPYDRTTGTLRDPECVIDTDPVIDASPDGMCIDTEGNIWIAFCHGGCVIQFDPRRGKELQRIHVPCRETTACTFGGSGLNDLYITTGIPGKDAEPLAGRVFVVRDIGVSGLPLVAFRDI
jgi:sugar lactone lactonase YvrE